MPAFALTIFIGAFLLLQVQPLIGKFILPWFGGGTAVWTTCQVFFQVLLLGGYAYAHWSASRLRARNQAVLHLLLLAAALLLLPAIPGNGWKPADADHPTGRILLLLGATVGLPYFVLSATGPLVQHWFRLSRTPGLPYRLYALSNAGSLLALVTYPFLIEPVFTRRTQALMWSWGLALYAASMLLCVWRIWRVTPGLEFPSAVPSSNDAAVEKITGLRKFLWLALPACASILLLAITNKICLDVAVIPFLWVLPLGLYLFSFVLCFNGPWWYWRKFYGVMLIPALLLLYNELFEPGSASVAVKITVFSWALFNLCMVCHGELYRLRPHPRRLTGFYLMVAAGGAAGGLLVALVAPHIFADYWELHWGLALFAAAIVLVCRREQGRVKIEGRQFPVWPAVAGGAMILIVLLLYHFKDASRLRMATARNFYGVLRLQVGNQATMGTAVRSLSCGTTLHGFQPLDPGLEFKPTAYYHEQSGVGLVLQDFPRPGGLRVGVVGLGIGTVAAYGRSGDVFRFYEINPDVRRFANDYFSYLSNSPAQIEIVMGDARLSMERETPQNFDVLILDAFSSDAIPVHLLTKEAFDVYLRHLKPGGVIAAHISGRHVNLVPVLDNLGAAFHLETADMHWNSPFRAWWTLPTHWYLMSRNHDFMLLPDIRNAITDETRGPRTVKLWTDDYSSLFPVLK